MAFRLFGFDIRREKTPAEIPTVVQPANVDGSLVVNSMGGFYTSTIDINQQANSENELIQQYRVTAQYADVDSAIEDITNEAIVSEGVGIQLNMDELDLPETIKAKFIREFDRILKLLKFRESGHDLFKSWYVDGRLYFNIIVDIEHPERGIIELRPIDPRKIRRVKEVQKESNGDGVEIQRVVDEYYVYNDQGIAEGMSVSGVRLSLDSVIYVPSGIVDGTTGLALSNLQKAVKPTNMLKMIEDSLVIYRISRAPERRVFYIDTGNLPKIKAEQYVVDLMNKYRNKIVYDASTGEVQNSRAHTAITEDFWLPRREGGKGTEITTLNGGQSLAQVDDVIYFQQKLYQALNVPLSRLKPDDGFSLGRATEITRDEIKFSKFIDRLRRRFNTLFFEALKTQLVLKSVVTIEEWGAIVQDIELEYDEDNHFVELKNSDVLQQRLQMLSTVAPYVDQYFSKDWVQHNILQLNDQEILQMSEEIKKNPATPSANNTTTPGNENGNAHPDF